MKTLNDLNMKYVCGTDNEEITGGAILNCSRFWTKEQLKNWLPDFDQSMIGEVKMWLENDACIAEGLSLKIWID